MMMPRTSICNKETRARIENLRPSELLVAKTALIMLNFMLFTLQKKRREGGHQRKIWNVDETLSKASVLQRRGHQRKTWNVGAPLSKASVLRCCGHQRKNGTQVRLNQHRPLRIFRAKC